MLLMMMVMMLMVMTMTVETFRLTSVHGLADVLHVFQLSSHVWDNTALA